MGDGGGGFFRGTSMDQDARFSNKEKKLISTMKFPPEYNTKVDMKKVVLEVIKPWISQQITEILGFEDEVLIGYVFGLLEERQFPDPKLLQIRITGFLEQDSSQFCLALWRLLISAQNSLGGIPPQFLAKKKSDILARKVETERIRAEIAKKTGASEAGNEVEDNGVKVDEEYQKKKVDKTIEELNKKYKNALNEEPEWYSSNKKRKSIRSRSPSPSKSRSKSRSRSRERARRRTRDDRYHRRSRRSPSDERRDRRKKDKDDKDRRRDRSSSRDRDRRDRSTSRERRNRSTSRDRRDRSTSGERSFSQDKKKESPEKNSKGSETRDKQFEKDMESLTVKEKELREKALSMIKEKQS